MTVNWRKCAVWLVLVVCVLTLAAPADARPLRRLGACVGRCLAAPVRRVRQRHRLAASPARAVLAAPPACPACEGASVSAAPPPADRAGGAGEIRGAMEPVLPD